jgi:hypothetical protein
MRAIAHFSVGRNSGKKCFSIVLNDDFFPGHEPRIALLRPLRLLEPSNHPAFDGMPCLADGGEADEYFSEFPIEHSVILVLRFNYFRDNFLTYEAGITKPLVYLIDEAAGKLFKCCGSPLHDPFNADVFASFRLLASDPLRIYMDKVRVIATCRKAISNSKGSGSVSIVIPGVDLAIINEIILRYPALDRKTTHLATSYMGHQFSREVGNDSLFSQPQQQILEIVTTLPLSIIFEVFSRRMFWANRNGFVGNMLADGGCEYAVACESDAELHNEEEGAMALGISLNLTTSSIRFTVRVQRRRMLSNGDGHPLHELTHNTLYLVQHFFSCFGANSCRCCYFTLKEVGIIHLHVRESGSQGSEL